MRMHNPGTIPLEAQYLYRRGLEMIDQHKESIALVYLKQAVFIAPEFSKAYLELGNCLARLGHADEAAVYFGKIYRMTSVDARNTIDGRIMKTRGEDCKAASRLLTCPVS